jgi:hypothetical protein
MNVTSGVNNNFMQHAPTNQQMRNTTYQPNAKMDPFGKVNLKARKVIENVERSRQTPADPRNGSTGGSFDDEITGANSPQNNMNNTTQNFYKPKGEINITNPLGNAPIYIPGGPKTTKNSSGHSNLINYGQPNMAPAY